VKLKVLIINDVLRYKASLLGAASNVIIDPKNPDRVIVKNITLLFEDSNAKSCTQSLPLESDFKIRIKEGEKYRIQFSFYVQREIVCGLKYIHKVVHIVPVAKEQYMIGSYPPSKEIVTFATPWETAPSG
jgi:Rho GDP-dissociation inhibitor